MPRIKGFLILPLLSLLLGCSSNVHVAPLPSNKDQPVELVLPSLNGGTVSLNEYRGRFVLLHLWASWCIPCTQELESLKRFQEQFSSTDLAVFSVAVDSDWDAVQNITSTRHVPFAVALDREGALRDSFHISGVPVTYLLDRKGRLMSILDPADSTQKDLLVGPREWARQAIVGRYKVFLNLN